MEKEKPMQELMSDKLQETMEAAVKYYLRKHKLFSPELEELSDLALIITHMKQNPILKQQEGLMLEALDIIEYFSYTFSCLPSMQLLKEKRERIRKILDKMDQLEKEKQA